jgi:nucleotide-binding universal stress UspA family protein
MLNFNRIVLPTDFSPTARRALSFAAHLAAQHDAVLHILHVRTPAEEREQPPGVEAPTTQDELAECAQQAADELGAPSAPAVQVLSLVRDSIVADSVPEAVAEYARENEADLIVMGTARRSGLRTLFPQSTASAVVRQAPCPVLTVLDEADNVPGPIDEIFVPYDFSEPAADALRYGEALAELYGATVTLVHVIHDLTVPMEYEVDVPEMATANVQSRAEAALQEVASDRHRVLVTTGNPGRRIVEVTEEHDADLLVLSTHGRTGLRRLLIGSVAEQVIRRAPCPVFTAKAFASSRDDTVAEPTAKAE